MFNFPITLPDFTAPEQSQVDVLKVLVQNADEHNGNADASVIADKIKGDMKKADYNKGAFD